MNSSKPFPWATAIIAATVVCLAVIGSVVFLKSCDKSNEELNQLAGAARDVSRNFVTGNITTTFLEDIPVISSTQGDVLELATSKANETFEREDSLNSVWGSGIYWNNHR